tara:strand:- start:1171 stop:1980 length:810 start_codon:yes stop_codon:yes gene_type:complete
MTEKKQILDKSKILRYLDPKNLLSLKEVIIYEEIGSTNDAIKKEMQGFISKSDVIAVLAEKQTAGRGTGGKKWFSPAYKNIYLSFSWNSALAPSQLEGLSLAAAVEVTKALEHSLALKFNLKWPNDIFLSGKKVGGILIETTQSNKLTNIVIGIGLNVFMEKKNNVPIDQDWTSISNYLEGKADRNKIIGTILNVLIDLRGKFEDRGFAPYKPLFEDLNLLKDQICEVDFHGKRLNGIVKGISDKGELVFATKEKMFFLRSGQALIKKA